MRQLNQYEEVLEFYVTSGGMKVFKPSPVDLALKRANVASLQEALSAVYDPEQERPDIKEIRERLDVLQETGGEMLEEAKQTLKEWESERRMRWNLLKARLQQEEWALKQMSQEAPQGMEIIREVFGMREFSHKERLEADSDCTTTLEETRESKLDEVARDALLLFKSLRYYYAVNAKGKKSEQTPIEDPEELPDPIYQILVGRMWAQHGPMTAQLVGFFR